MADKLMALRGRATQQSGDTRKTSQTKQPAISSLKLIFERYNRPANVDHHQVPEVDLQLWRAIDHTTRCVDLQIQQNMHTLTKYLGPMLDIFMSPSANVKEDFKQVKDLAKDSFKIMAHSFATSICQMKERIKNEPQLKPRVKTFLSQTTTSATSLFGDSLKDDMKTLNDGSFSLVMEPNPESQSAFFVKRGCATFRKWLNPQYRPYKGQTRPIHNVSRPYYKKGASVQEQLQKMSVRMSTNHISFVNTRDFFCG